MNKYNFRRNLQRDVERAVRNGVNESIANAVRTDELISKHAATLKTYRGDLESNIATQLLRRFRMIRR